MNNNYVYLWHLLLMCQFLINIKKTSLKEKYPFQVCDSLSFEGHRSALFCHIEI